MPDSTTHTLPPRLAKIFLLPLLFMIVACDGDGASLRVFAASSLTGAFNDIALAFEAENPGIRVKLDFGGSQRMRSQLEFGAKADVFASADTIQMDALVEQDLVAGIPVDFALNSLVVLAMAKGPVNEIADLARPGVKVVLANDVVPVGSYSIQVLKNLSQNPIYGLGIGFKDRVLANRVSGEPNVGNLFQKVVLGEVDAGIVYETDTARSLDARTKDIFFISIPDAANVSARYPIAVLEDAPEPELAQQFVQFVLSNAGQTLLHGYGFSSP
ncbi:MAG TPA: molybdate ABC transporter substrate-binding protein [Dehalococcoidia bacterium]|nr:molybdate ABC transporter substrate-binding protein [Dehalococcoidia bacterium]